VENRKDRLPEPSKEGRKVEAGQAWSLAGFRSNALRLSYAEGKKNLRRGASPGLSGNPDEPAAMPALPILSRS